MKTRLSLLLLFAFYLSSAQTQLSVAYVTGKFDQTHHPDFTAVTTPYTNLPAQFLRKDVYKAFKKMYDAAAKEKISLNIISSTRNFDYQKGIWERKWIKFADTVAATVRAKKILEYSAMPGISRHHWGTDVDLINLTNEYFDSTEGKRAYVWLQKNAATYGFCQPYTAGRAQGYNEERWHWSYMRVSKLLTAWAGKNLNTTFITGFSGSETATSLNVVRDYVLGINKDCL